MSKDKKEQKVGIAVEWRNACTHSNFMGGGSSKLRNLKVEKTANYFHKQIPLPMK